MSAGDDLLAALPARRGHFLLESGYHTDLWLTLDAVFADPATVAPLVAELADKLRRHPIAAVCGPLVGGAFLAQTLAQHLGVAFHYTEPVSSAPRKLFAAEYRLPAELARRAGGQRVAVVDDVISAGSSVRATIAALGAAGASTVVVGALLVLGEAAVAHFEDEQIPMEMLGAGEFNLWPPAECPLCRAGVSLDDPRP